MIIYIHGFGSSGQGGKAQKFREYYKKKGVDFIAPSLSYVPELAISTLEELINNCSNPKLMGSSLGGFYAIYLADKYNLKAVLINPAIKATSTLQRYVKEEKLSTNYYDLSQFEFNQRHLNMLKNYVVENPKGEYLLMLQKGDEVLDYKDALNYLSSAKKIVEEGGSHTFDGIERYYKEIDKFLGL